MIYNNDMKIVQVISVFLLFLSLSSAVSLAQTQSTVYPGMEVTPVPLIREEIVTLMVDPVKCGLPDNGTPVYAVMIAYQSGNAVASDTLMTKTGGSFTARFAIPQGTDAVAFRFLQGRSQVANNGAGYIFKVADKSGAIPAPTWYSLYILQTTDRTAGISKRDAGLATKYYRDWYQFQDTGKMSFYENATALYTLKDTIALCRHLEKISPEMNLTEEQLSNLQSYARLCGMPSALATGDLRKQLYPRGDWYWRPWLDSLKAISTVDGKKKLIEAFEKANPGDASKEHPLVNEMYFNVIGSADKTSDISTLLYYGSMLEQDPELTDRTVSVYIYFLGQLIKQDTLTAECTSLALKVVKMAESKVNTPELRDPGQSKQTYLENSNRLYMSSISLYAGFLNKQEQYDSAAIYAGKASRFMEWKSPGYNDRYFTAAEKVKPADEVLTELETAFLQEGYTANMKQIFLRLYSSKGNTDGEAVLNSLTSGRTARLREELKLKMKSEPAPDFIFTDLNGEKISLESLRGKVVLLDFWATWCKPCISSFPAMQMLVNSNKERNDVSILFVNTLQYDKDRARAVKQFMSDKPYDFNVLLDPDDKAVKAFNIAGIPTKIIVDKKGIIRFVSVGFNADEQKSIEELQVMIDLAGEV